MKKILVILLSVCLVLVLTSGCSSSTAETKSQPSSTPAQELNLTIATASMTGTYYPFGAGISTIINDYIDGAKCSVEASAGTVENLNLLQKGTADLAIGAANIISDAVNGRGAYEGKKITGVSAITAMYPEIIQVIAPKNSKFESVYDFKDKHVSVGGIGSGTEAMSREILAVHDMSYDDIKEDYLTIAEAATGIKDGTLDAIIWWSGIPTSGVLDLATQKPIKIIEIKDKPLDNLLNKLPFCMPITIPANTYPGQDVAVNSVAIPSLLIVKDDMSEDFVYQLTKNLYEHKDIMVSSHKQAENISHEFALSGLKDIPLHPGAIKYYKEVGVIK